MDEDIRLLVEKYKKQYTGVYMLSRVNTIINDIYAIDFLNETINDALLRFERLVNDEINYSDITKNHYIKKSQLLIKKVIPKEEHKTILNYIEDTTYIDTELIKSYSCTNTIKVFYQVILIIISTLKLNLEFEKHKFYLNKFDSYNVKSKTEMIEKTSINVQSYDQLKEMFKIFPEYSIENFLLELYRQAPVRNDYGNCIIVKSLEDANNKEINYLIWPNQQIEPTIFVLQEYKTSKKYGRILINFNERISEFLIEMKKQYGHYLITTRNYKPYTNGAITRLTKAYKKLGIDGLGSTNFLRHLIISEELKNVTNIAERESLTKKLCHSPVTTLLYVRQLGI